LTPSMLIHLPLVYLNQILELSGRNRKTPCLIDVNQS
jgi:hypothetical protein